MKNSLDELKIQYSKGTDTGKLEILLKLSNQELTPEMMEFLYKVIEEERYEKLRIKAILILMKEQTQEIVKKLGEIYAYERDESVRLAIIQYLTPTKENNALQILKAALENDTNDKIRAIALKNLHESKEITKEEMKKIIESVIIREKAKFPKQIALGIVKEYADEKIIETLKKAYLKEKSYKMQKLLYQTLVEIYERMGREPDLAEPEMEVVNEKKKKRKKKGKKEEDYLYFA
ncbi:MAG: HEAT repeat domain-containing protein [Candidatus Heimdallarchaeaceae archaeon]